MAINRYAVRVIEFTDEIGMSLAIQEFGVVLFRPSPADAYEGIGRMPPEVAQRVIRAHEQAKRRIDHDAKVSAPPVTGLPKTDATIAAAFADRCPYDPPTPSEELELMRRR